MREIVEVFSAADKSRRSNSSGPYVAQTFRSAQLQAERLQA